jgi:hypothetical protein
MRYSIFILFSVISYNASALYECVQNFDTYVKIETQPGTTATVSDTIWTIGSGTCSIKYSSSVTPSMITMPTGNTKIMYTGLCSNRESIGAWGLKSSIISVTANNQKLISCNIQYFYDNGCWSSSPGELCECSGLNTTFSCDWYNGNSHENIGMNYHKDGNYFTIWQAASDSTSMN